MACARGADAARGWVGAGEDCRLRISTRPMVMFTLRAPGLGAGDAGVRLARIDAVATRPRAALSARLAKNPSTGAGFAGTVATKTVGFGPLEQAREGR